MIWVPPTPLLPPWGMPKTLKPRITSLEFMQVPCFKADAARNETDALCASLLHKMLEPVAVPTDIVLVIIANAPDGLQINEMK